MFRFKQFTIHQNRAAMKVCTDACVLGAYANAGMGGRVLDIGTGTGLLALMAAQRNHTALIDAVEVDETACQQAVENVAGTPFADRVRVWHGRIQDFCLPSPFGRGAGAVRRSGEGHQYDRILTNPPFFTNHLRSPDAGVNRALHTDELPFPELIMAVTRLLKPGGQWWVMLPPIQTRQLINLAREVGLLPFKQLSLRHQVQKSVFRIITGYSFEPSEMLKETLVIREADGKTYTPEFQALLRDFYLIF